MLPADDNLDALAGREWLETNGLGSYASGTACGASTRRYHGLLVAALTPPVRRHVLLASMEEVLEWQGREIPFSTHFYRHVVHPDGYRHLLNFEARPVATWTFAVDGIELERRVWLPHGTQAVVISYRLLGTPDQQKATLRLRPLLAFRDFHALRKESDGFSLAATDTPGRVSFRPIDDLPQLFLHHNGWYRHQPEWYRGFRYDIEDQRGFDAYEDLLSPGMLEFDLAAGEAAFVHAGLEPVEGLDAGALFRLETAELQRRRERASLAARARTSGRDVPLDRWADTLAARLAEAAEQFLVRRADRARTVVAGYHWFADWGRDTFISLPGLAAVTGRWPLAKEILESFIPYIDRGMVPNRFPEGGSAPEYNTVDAALWFIDAARRYAQESADHGFVSEKLLPVLEEIIEWHSAGTRHGIGVDPADGLLFAGEPGVALTWMDAIVDGVAVTPRHGKPVEVNALWYNALIASADMAASAGRADLAEVWKRRGERVRTSFNKRFWSEELGHLYDVVDGPYGDDPSLRPNQVIAISLPHTVLDERYRRPVMEIVEARLLTPMGLRTLDPADRRYRGRYEGGVLARDTAYHNGTVWPWLLGPFASALYRTFGDTAETRGRVRNLIVSMSRHLGTEACLGQLSEIADGDAPHEPRGCIAQAWSVAEVARVLLEA
jgi:predicted glycogen debranching enzyme